MSHSPSRNQLRQETAALVNGLKKVELRNLFGISRVADITHLDNIGLPVFSAVRPLSNSLAIHSGKGLDPDMARAGAIMEAIEFEISTNPTGPFLLRRAIEIPHDDRMELEDCFPVRSSVVNDLTPLPWEFMTNVQTGAPKLVPSELIWLINRVSEQPLLYLQSGSNGIASGATLEDAILSGLYEILERDGWTLSQYLMDNYGVLPQRSPLVALPERIESCVRKIEQARVKLHLFDISNDYAVPVFNAVLLDLSGNVAGTFGGYGAHLNAEIAAIRAITEAAQARCCYINGARDDLFRRQFILMKRMDQVKLDQMFSELPTTNPISDYRSISFPDVKTELRYLLKLIKQFGVSEVYVKDLSEKRVLDGQIRVVRVFSPQCEPNGFDSWTPTFRCRSYCERYMRELGEKKEKKKPKVEEGEEWKEMA